MEQFEYYLEAFVGIALSFVVQLLKKWASINMPIVKFLMVGVLSFGAAFGLAQLYPVDLTIKDLILKSALIAFEAIGIKVFIKSLK